MYRLTPKIEISEPSCVGTKFTYVGWVAWLLAFKKVLSENLLHRSYFCGSIVCKDHFLCGFLSKEPSITLWKLP